MLPESSGAEIHALHRQCVLVALGRVNNASGATDIAGGGQ